MTPSASSSADVARAAAAAKLLMVEDERNVAETLAERLRDAGFQVVRADSVASARRAIAEQEFKLALLDVGLPDGNGFELARLLRERAPATAIVFLTAHASAEDRIHGLELGADDYIGKPFHFRELLLRIQNSLKRAQDLAQVPGEMRGQVHIGKALVDFERFSATADGENRALTHKECAVLRLLAERVGKAVSRNDILDRAWSADEFPTSRTVDNFIVRLRKLVEVNPADPRVIRSIRGVGYLLTEIRVIEQLQPLAERARDTAPTSEPLLLRALARRNGSRPPVWFMRQAGRYHRHYQVLRARHEFMQLCKQPALAAEVTLGPIEEFGFDAAILFSDLLFPLEAMGMGLRYAPAPQLDWHLRATGDLARLRGGAERVRALDFQGEALRLLRARLPQSCALIGFVGGPYTLYAYAVAGSHEGFATDGLAGQAGLDNGLYTGFTERLRELLVANMALQAEAGADCVAIFDTAAGTLAPGRFDAAAAPLAEVVAAFRRRCPHTPVIYYSRDTGPAHWERLRGSDLQCLGIDWRCDLPSVLQQHGRHWAIQGNIDPQWLLLPSAELEARLRAWFERLRALPAALRAGWVCGLGHGVLQNTPESNVKLVLALQREIFDERSAG